MSDLASAIGIRADEQELVAELKAGSEQAFALLLAQYSHPIYSLMARSLSDKDAGIIEQTIANQQQAATPTRRSASRRQMELD